MENNTKKGTNQMKKNLTNDLKKRKMSLHIDADIKKILCIYWYEQQKDFTAHTKLKSVIKVI